jgi:MFS family permease
MKQERNFLYITFADLIARSAYQMGKTPLLPLFAAMLGATDTFLGIIVSVSTLTGMLFKPFVGILSDRWGRKGWLLLGTLFFAIVPFFYWLVQTPQQLFLIRIIHGTATAIYGPVTVAYVAENWPGRRAERLGWFSMARSAGYIVGPAAAGWMLLTMQPAAVFTIIGLLSSIVFLPILRLPESTAVPSASTPHPPLMQQIRQAFHMGSKTPAIWLSGSMDATAYIALYAIKAFVPVYALSIGINVAVVGLFFAVQELVHMVVQPAGGRLGDKWGYLPAISLGMLLLGLALPLLPLAHTTWGLMGITILLGLAQAFIFPSTTALVSAQIDGRNLGAAMGIIGTLDNAGKVIGPVLGGLLIARFDYAVTFDLLGGLLLLGAVLVGVASLSRRRWRPTADAIG